MAFTPAKNIWLPVIPSTTTRTITRARTQANDRDLMSGLEHDNISGWKGVYPQLKEVVATDPPVLEIRDRHTNNLQDRGSKSKEMRKARLPYVNTGADGRDVKGRAMLRAHGADVGTTESVGREVDLGTTEQGAGMREGSRISMTATQSGNDSYADRREEPTEMEEQRQEGLEAAKQGHDGLIEAMDNCDGTVGKDYLERSGKSRLSSSEMFF